MNDCMWSREICSPFSLFSFSFSPPFPSILLLCLPLSYLDLAKAIVIKPSKDKLLVNERRLFTIELMLINLLISVFGGYHLGYIPGASRVE